MGLGLVIFLFAMVVAVSPYRDYVGSRMPDYGIDDENHEMTPIPDDFIDKSPHAGASFDYRNEDERDSRKHALDMEIDDYVINKNKRFSSKSKIETQEEIMPEDKPRKRNGKTNRRNHSRFNSEGGNSNNKYNRFRKVDNDNTINEDYREKEEDYRENEEKETKRFHRREIINRQARRKTRDRPLNVILQDTDDKYVKGDEGFSALEDKIQEKQKSESSEYEFEDMRRVNDIKEKLTVTPKRTTGYQKKTNKININDDVTDLTKTSTTSSQMYTITVLETSRKPTTLNRRMNTPEKKKLSSKPIPKAGELSMAERSRLSILKKVNKKENLNTTKTAKPPVLMQVTNQIQTVVMVEPNMYKEMPRVKQVVENSPERVGVAKKLMRRKLVANVKSLQELTDNWDEMICDYIDVSLLNVACRLPQDCRIYFILASLVLTV